MGGDKPGEKKARAEETDKRILSQKLMHSKVPGRKNSRKETRPEDGVVEMDGGFMMTTSEILDFSEGTDSFV